MNENYRQSQKVQEKYGEENAELQSAIEVLKKEGEKE